MVDKVCIVCSAIDVIVRLESEGRVVQRGGERGKEAPSRHDAPAPFRGRVVERARIPPEPTDAQAPSPVHREARVPRPRRRPREPGPAARVLLALAVPHPARRARLGRQCAEEPCRASCATSSSVAPLGLRRRAHERVERRLDVDARFRRRLEEEAAGLARKGEALLCRDDALGGRLVALVAEHEKGPGRVVGREDGRGVGVRRLGLAEGVQEVGEELERVGRVDRVAATRDEGQLRLRGCVRSRTGRGTS